MAVQDAPEVAALLAAMRAKPSVPDGWDAAIHFSQAAVQSLLLGNRSAAPQDGPVRSLLWTAPEPVDGVHDVVGVTTALPPPAVTLNADNQVLHLSYAIASGTVQFGKVAADDVVQAGNSRTPIDEANVSWNGSASAVSPQSPVQFVGAIPLHVETAADARSVSIGLNLAEAKLSVSGQGENSFATEAANHDLTGWLAEHAVNHQIASLTLRDGKDAHILAPAAVGARIVPATSGEPVLQILTGSSPGAVTPDPDPSDPAPHIVGDDFSFVVGSQSTMGMVASGYNLGSGAIKLVSVPPSDGQVHWFAQVHQPMVFQGTFGNMDGDTYVTDHASLYMCFGGSTDQGLKLFTYVDPASTIQLQLDLAANYPVGFTGTGEEKFAALQPGAQSVGANGFYEAIVQPQLEKFLTGDIQSDMTKVQLTAASELLLHDLLLDGQMPGMEFAALPGDLLISGNLEPAT